MADGNGALWIGMWVAVFLVLVIAAMVMMGLWA
jgi:hypothetical protein